MTSATTVNRLFAGSGLSLANYFLKRTEIVACAQTLPNLTKNFRFSKAK